MPSPDPETSRTPVDLPARVRLVLLFGGRSAEHDISCISASNVLAAVDPGRYDVVPVGITRDGCFVLAEAGPELEATGDTVALHEILDVEGPTTSTGETPTVVLPILHGPNGEDGTIQGALEVAGVPYVGSGVLASAVAMDKDMAKTVLAARGIPQTPWRAIHAHSPPDEVGLSMILAELGPVVFVKPANMGSSIGVSRVSRGEGTAALARALETALRYDDVVVTEAGVEGRELECAVLGNEEPRSSVLGEVVSGAMFYDYDDKYFDGRATTIIPAELDALTMTAGQELAVRTFEALRCTGMARVDMFLRDDGELLVNEVNTIPGFTPISMYPKLWEASGLSYPALVDELVALALRAHERRTLRSVAP
jgi:D-alanine-D-alanine ligase